MNAGRYTAKKKGNFSFTESQSGNIMIGCVFDTGPDGTITWRKAITEKTTKYVVEALRNMGWTGNDLSNEDELNAQCSNEVSIDVQEREYEGQIYTEVAWVNSLLGGKPAEGGKLAKAKAMLRAMALSANSTAPAPQANPDEDLPF